MFAVLAATFPAISSRPPTERSMLQTALSSIASRAATISAAPKPRPSETAQ